MRHWQTELQNEPLQSNWPEHAFNTAMVLWEITYLTSLTSKVYSSSNNPVEQTNPEWFIYQAAIYLPCTVSLLIQVGP